MLPALTYAASVGWCRATNEGQDTAAALDAVVLPDGTGRAGAALLAAGEVYAQTGVVQPNGSALHDALAGGGMGGLGEPTAESLGAVEATLADVDDALAATRFSDPDGLVAVRELRQAVALARHGASRLARRHGLPSPDDATLTTALDELREEQIACWNARSRPGGLSDSLARLPAR